MIILNYGHPLTDSQQEDIERFVGEAPKRLLHLGGHHDAMESFGGQATMLADQAGLEASEWESEPILLLPPTLHVMAVALLAELHGRMGYFPSVVRLRAVQGLTPPRFEVAEIINLQEIRDRARSSRRRTAE